MNVNVKPGDRLVITGGKGKVRIEAPRHIFIDRERDAKVK